MPSPARRAATLELGGHSTAPAISVGGRTVSYHELAALIDGVDTDHGWLDATGLPMPDALATVFAAARAGIPVLLADPAGIPQPAEIALSAAPGTFLIAVTSGSSGRPRPVLRTTASWTMSFAPLAELGGLGARDRVLLTGPLHSTMHLFAAVHTLWLGAELTDRAGHATAVHAVPAVFDSLLNGLPPSAPLRTAVVAGAELPARIAGRATARSVTVTEYYGAAELSFVAAARHPGPLHPFPGAEVRLRGGEIWVRSPYLATGYGAGVTGPLRRDVDGFATVGDLGEWLDGELNGELSGESSNPVGGDVNGELGLQLGAELTGRGLRVRGRGDAAITTGGATVIAEDIEAALCALPGVAAAAVVGVPHQQLGEVVTAVIEPDGTEAIAGIRAAARLVLKGPALPRRWFTAPRLPLTGNGKIARATIGEAVRRAVAGDDPAEHALSLRPLP